MTYKAKKITWKNFIEKLEKSKKFAFIGVIDRYKNKEKYNLKWIEQQAKKHDWKNKNVECNRVLKQVRSKDIIAINTDKNTITTFYKKGKIYNIAKTFYVIINEDFILTYYIPEKSTD